MKKRLFVIMLGIVGICSAQTNTISLSECYQKALDVHPRQAETASRQQISALNRNNLNARWLPTLEINAKASYISDVVSFDETLGQLPLPTALPEMPHEHYAATLDVKQVIYDGGSIRQGKALEAATLASDLAALETDVYRIIEQINQVYFGLLALQQQSAIIQLFQENLAEQRIVLEAGIKNGIMLPGTLDALDAELLKIDQKLAELSISEKYSRTVLATLIGIPVDDSNILLPEIAINFSTPIDRPENHLFEAKAAQLQVNRKALFSQRLPTAYAFGSVGYGQPPGNNLFASDFESYYSVGAGIRWNIF
ncbi:TolC family protein, partial [bacterium]|nr:TolC family protein [bacterium]